MKNPEVHDLVVIGGGPAGLTAAMTAETERLDAIVLDSGPQVGGQAGTTSLIRNYPGFPKGVSGPELMANIVDQALEFDTEFIGPTRVINLHPQAEGILVQTEDGDEYLGSVALLSMGVEPRHIKARNLAAYVGRGATYGAPTLNTPQEGHVFVIGGANSAGQAAEYLSSYETCKVHLLVRGDSIEDKMSGYLVDEVMEKVNQEKIVIHTQAELIGVNGNGHLEKVVVKQGDETIEMPANEVYVLIGSEPKTLWLPNGVERDGLGFITAGSDISEKRRAGFIEETGRPPYAHETAIPRLFVAGDVRCGTNKRIALAIGDGAAVIPEIHNLRAFESSKA